MAPHNTVWWSSMKQESGPKVQFSTSLHRAPLNAPQVTALFWACSLALKPIAHHHHPVNHCLVMATQWVAALQKVKEELSMVLIRLHWWCSITIIFASNEIQLWIIMNSLNWDRNNKSWTAPELYAVLLLITTKDSASKLARSVHWMLLTLVREDNLGMLH
jgi:hypothetical protein